MVEYSIPIPEEVKAKLDLLSKCMGIRMEAVVLFSIIRYLEVQRGDPGPNIQIMGVIMCGS